MDAPEDRKRKLCLKKKKRKRTVIPAEELDILERAFQRDQRPDRLAKLELGKELNKPCSFVSIWFQNRRARERKINPGQRSVGEPSRHHTTSASYECNDSVPQQTTVDSLMRSRLFYRCVRMAAVAEGKILPLDSPCLSEAITDACRGIRLADCRLIYHPDYGFDTTSLYA